MATKEEHLWNRSHDREKKELCTALADRDECLAHITKLRLEVAAARATLPVGELHFVCDGPPDHESGRFVEVENERGESIKVGRWEQRGKYWHLIVPMTKPTAEAPADIEELKARVEKLEDKNARLRNDVEAYRQSRQRAKAREKAMRELVERWRADLRKAGSLYSCSVLEDILDGREPNQPADQAPEATKP